MIHKRLWLSASIIALIILVGFILSVPHTRDLPRPSISPDTEAVVPKVTVRDVYKKGVHTLTGSVEAPNPCTTLSVSASVATSSGTEAILLAISLPQDTGVCLQNAVMLPFSTTVTASLNVPVKATVNDVSAVVTEL
jgi:hypothetical protein